MGRCLIVFTLAAAGLLLAGCSGLGGPQVEGEGDDTGAYVAAAPMVRMPPERSPAAAATGVRESALSRDWTHRTFPGKRATEFVAESRLGRPAVRATTQRSMSVLRQAVRVEPADLGRLRFAWKLGEANPEADMGDRDAEDAPLRVVLVFEGDRSQFSARNRALSDLAHALTGEPLPYATLMYVWCNTREAGTVITNPRTDRIRKLVVQSGLTDLNRWLEYERDIRADYEAAFGEPPGPLVGIALMSDSDNTGGRSVGWYAQPQLLHPALARP